MRLTVILVFVAICIQSNVHAQSHSLTKLWETDTTLKVPESVYFDANANVLYVANIDGQPGEKDGRGSIGKVSPDGKIINAAWVQGLNAPKGMAVHQNTLWVADLAEMVAIDLKEGKIVQKIAVDSAVFLNDVTADKNGVVYVSDSRTRKVHRIENGKVTTHLDGLKGPNGLLHHQGTLYVLDQGSMFKVGADKTLTKLAEGMEGGTDGIEHVEGNDFIVSCWGGTVYYVKGDGSKELLLDTREQKINAADIGYDPKKKIVYVPTFWKNNVVAYQLK